ncbi:MAG: 30S ribosomal protein S16 [Gammaproteobacteria bacterium]|nr:30S ribosomal protein S16 [Gammaproteobacteria bacterium]MCP4475495.1 30S ribosomal protein S16 [Gammaproteobacteria bacterium]
MVTIRLSRSGAKKSPFYHIVVIDSRTRRDGRSIERLGYFNPVARGNSPRLSINTEAIDLWIGKGAQISNRVAALVKEAKEPQRFETIVAKREKKKAQQVEAKAQATAAAEKEAEAAASAKAEEAESSEKTEKGEE